MEDDTQPKTHKKTYDWLKPYQFKEGNPGGPGRPKGPTLKTWLRDRFSEMTEEERAEFLNQVDPIKAWEMAEGKAEAKTEVEGSMNVNISVPKAVADTFNINAGADTETGGVSKKQE